MKGHPRESSREEHHAILGVLGLVLEIGMFIQASEIIAVLLEHTGELVLIVHEAWILSWHGLFPRRMCHIRI
jgi:hypothetical protein